MLYTYRLVLNELTGIFLEIIQCVIYLVVEFNNGVDAR